MPSPLTSTLPQQVRQGTTTFGPITIPAGYSSYSLQLNIAKADYEASPSGKNAITFAADVSPDGTNWTNIQTATWKSTGGPNTSKTGVVDPPPVVSCDITSYAGTHQIRAALTLNNPMTVGATLTVT
jgi:hypothetical protein